MAGEAKFYRSHSHPPPRVAFGSAAFGVGTPRRCLNYARVVSGVAMHYLDRLSDVGPRARTLIGSRGNASGGAAQPCTTTSPRESRGARATVHTVLKCSADQLSSLSPGPDPPRQLALLSQRPLACEWQRGKPVGGIRLGRAHGRA